GHQAFSRPAIDRLSQVTNFCGKGITMATLYPQSGAAIAPSLLARGERKLVRHTGSKRYLCCTIAAPAVKRAAADRLPIHLAMVIDRSGSMQGDKLVTAKRAALAVLNSLDERDKTSVVVFDERIDTVQPLAQATEATKSAIHEALK